MNFIYRVRNAIIKGYGYSIASKLSLLELSLIMISLLMPILYYLNNVYVIFLYIGVVISVILTIKDQYNEEKKKWSNFYKNTFRASISLQFINIIVLFIFSKGMELSGLIALSLGLVNYLLIWISLIIFILNIVFWGILKFIFPFENTDELTKRNIPLKELSKYMSINDQVIYFIIMVLHFVMRHGIAVYIYFLVLINSKETQVSIDFLKFIEKIESLEIVSMGNLLGLLSILLAIATVTLQAQLKIEKSAYQNINQEYND